MAVDIFVVSLRGTVYCGDMTPFTGANLLLLLFAGHALADFPLQGDFLAQGKNRHTALGKVWWLYALTAHAAIHGGVVILLTGSAWLGLAEFVCHWIVDLVKCEDSITLAEDQIFHIICKVLWWSVIMYTTARF